jgi:RNA polymerase sigma-70 factor (ECF subfamily)
MNMEVSKSTGQFATTRWSVVLMAGQAVSAESATALEKLCHAYWQPVCTFARRKGWSEEDAKDLTQQFFSHLLSRNCLSGLTPQKGKFRTFLLASFTNFMANEYDRINAQKRGGGRQIFSLEEFADDGWGAVPPAETLAPEEALDLCWAKNILAAALHELKREMLAAHKAVQFEELKPFLTTNAGASEYGAVAEKLGIDAASVPVRVHRLRQRYRELVREEVAQTVSTPVELEEEMRHLFELLNR